MGFLPVSVVIGDFNNDGKQDFVAANQASPNSNVSIRLGNGDGTFSAAANVSVSDQPDSVVIGDFDNDGKQDLAVVAQAADLVSDPHGKWSGRL